MKRILCRIASIFWRIVKIWAEILWILLGIFLLLNLLFLIFINGIYVAMDFI